MNVAGFNLISLKSQNLQKGEAAVGCLQRKRKQRREVGGGEAMDGMQSEQSEGNPRLKGVLIPGKSLCQYKLWIKTGQGPYYTMNFMMHKEIFSLSSDL